MKEFLLVVLGFVLAQVEKWFLDRPRVRLSFKKGYIQFIGNEPGGMPKEINPIDANILNIELLVDIYNIGRAPTAIKDVLLRLWNPMGPSYFTPSNSLKEIGESGFNLSPGALEPMKLKLTVVRDENNWELFENIVWFSDLGQQSKIKVIARDIYDKEHTIEIDLLALKRAT